MKYLKRLCFFNYGFTLTELLVVIAILGTLMGISIPTYNTFNRYQQLNQSAENLVTLLKKLQNSALNNEYATSCKDPTPIYEGILFHVHDGNNKINQVFASCVNKTGFNTGTCSGGGYPPPNNDAIRTRAPGSEQLDIPFLNPAITVASIQTMPSNSNLENSPVIFFPPLGKKIQFYHDFNQNYPMDLACLVPDNEAKITLSAGSESKIIHVTTNGSIYLE